MSKTLAAIAMIMTAATTALPSQVEACPVTVVALGTDSWGNVVATFNSSGTSYFYYICSLTGTVTLNNGTNSGNVTSGACNALFAELLTARASGQTIQLNFNSGNCTMPPGNTWMNPYPGYFLF